MLLEVALETVAASDREDWEKVRVPASAGRTGEVWIYRGDVDLRIEEFEVDRDPTDRVNVDWATNFPDQTAWKEVYVIYCGQSPIETVHLVDVDGSRASLPFATMPSSKEVRRLDYKVAVIVNHNEQSFFDYFRRVGFTVGDE